MSKSEPLHLYQVWFSQTTEGNTEHIDMLVSATNYFDAERWANQEAEKMHSLTPKITCKVFSVNHISNIPNASDDRKVSTTLHNEAERDRYKAALEEIRVLAGQPGNDHNCLCEHQ